MAEKAPEKGPEIRDVKEAREIKTYPRWKHHPHQKSRLVHSAKEEEELGKHWHELIDDAKKAKHEYDKEQEAKAEKEIKAAYDESVRREKSGIK